MFARALLSRRAAAGAVAAGSALAIGHASSSTSCFIGWDGKGTVAPAATWPKIKTQLQELYANENALNPSVDGAEGSKGGGGYVAPMMVRLAWHSAGSYRKEDSSGGTEGGTIRFAPEINHGGNAGLTHALALLTPIKKSNPSASWADLIVYAGCVAIEAMGGPDIPFHPGRTDAPRANVPPKRDKRFTPDDRLPDAAQGAQHLRDVFYRMGLDDREIVCLSGAHAVGRCHTDRSGFWGPWKYGEAAFSNEYFTMLLEKTWSEKVSHNGKLWKGPRQFEADEGKLMMLPTDMVLIEDPKFRVHVEAYAKDEALFFRDFALAFQRLLELCRKGLSEKH